MKVFKLGDTIVCKKDFSYNEYKTSRVYRSGKTYKIGLTNYRGDCFILTNDWKDEWESRSDNDIKGLWFGNYITDKSRYEYNIWDYFYTEKELRESKLKKLYERV